MKTYHITYFESKESYYSNGVNIEAKNPKKALKLFKKTYPNVIFFSMIVKVNELV